MGQLTQETFADGTSFAYGYDSHGNLISAIDGTNTTTFQYDPTGTSLLQVNYPGGRFLKFTYDLGDRRTQSVDQNGFTVNYTYSAVGLLAGLTDSNGNPIVTYTYDSMGRLIREDKGNLTYTTHTYNLAGNILHLVNYAPDGSVNSRFDYSYDSLGRRTSMTTLDGAWTYQYDPAGQLTHAVFVSNSTSVVPNQDLQYVYDLAGNRTETILNGVTTTYVTNNMNQYTQIGSANLTYDADGNLIAQTDSTGTTAYSYNELNRLIRASSPTGTSAYQYEPLGNLASVTQNGQITRYIVDPIGLGNVVAAYTGSGSLIANYTYGLGLTSTAASGGQIAYYDVDAVGSTVGLSGPSGNYQNLYRYLPFGEQLTSTESVANPFQFVGQSGIMTQSNRLDFMRARFYFPGDARFTSRDPIGLKGGQTNLYVYVGNEPLSRIDPSGMEEVDAERCAVEAAQVFEFCLAKVNFSLFGVAGCGLASAAYYTLCKSGALDREPDNDNDDGGGGARYGPGGGGPGPGPGGDPQACPYAVVVSQNPTIIVFLPCPPDPKSEDPNVKTGPAGRAKARR